MDQNTKYCINCGEKITMNTEFCPKCGTKQTTSNTNTHQYQAAPQQPVPNYVQTPKKTVGLLIGGWLATVITLFIPLIGVISLICATLVIKREKVVAGVVLIVFTIIFFYLGITGFAQGFFGAL